MSGPRYSSPSPAELAATVRKALREPPSIQALACLEALSARCEELEQARDEQSSIDRAYGWRQRAERAERRVAELEASIRTITIEGVVYDPGLDSIRKGIETDDGEYIFIESLLCEGERVRVTIEPIASEGDDPR